MLPAKTEELIKSTELKYFKKINELATEGKTVSLDTLYQMVENPVKTDYTVLQWFTALIKDYRDQGRIGQVRVYTDAQNALKSFLNDKDIAFDEIDLPFLKRYERHLNKRKVKTSTFSIYMRTLRAALNKAIAEGYAKQYPFKDYSIPKGEPNRRALSIKDMEKLLKHKKINKNTDNYRIMVFSYFSVGMNYTDICRLTWDDIRGSEIHYTRQKIHYKIIIPIHPKVKAILDYYRPITGKTPSISGLNDNYIFPLLNKDFHITEQQIADRIHKLRKEFNDYLKTIGKVAGIDVSLSSYILRHTSITNLVRAGVTADAIMSLAGHKRLSTTEGYIHEASQQQKTKAVNML
jgi:site-specific recombinase XerD